MSFASLAYRRSDKESVRRIRRLEVLTRPITKGVLAKASSSAPSPPNVKQSTTPIAGGLQFQFTETGPSTGYRVYRNIADEAASAPLLDYLQGSPSGEDTFLYQDMVGSGTYYYWVAAVNEGGIQSDLIAFQGATAPTASDPVFSVKSANTVLAGPSTGIPATPGFRALVADDVTVISPGVTALSPAYVTLTDGATITWATGGARVNNAKVTIAGDRALSITGEVNGANGLLKVIQTGGGNTITVPANSKVANGGAGALTFSAGAGAIDMYAWSYDGTDFLWTEVLNFT